MRSRCESTGKRAKGMLVICNRDLYLSYSIVLLCFSCLGGMFESLRVYDFTKVQIVCGTGLLLGSLTLSRALFLGVDLTTVNQTNDVAT